MYYSMAEMSVAEMSVGRNVRGRNVRGRNVLAETSVAEMSVAEMSEHPWFQRRRFFYVFPYYKSMEANDPPGRGQLGPQGHDWQDL